MKTHTSSKTPLKPTKYQHFHLPGRSRGPPQTTKITPGASLDPPQTPSENLMCFRSLPGPPRGAPGASLGPPQAPPGTPQGRPETPQGPPDDLPRTPAGTQQSQRTPPATSRDPPRALQNIRFGTSGGQVTCACNLSPCSPCSHKTIYKTAIRPSTPQGPPPRFGPAECAERLNNNISFIYRFSFIL